MTGRRSGKTYFRSTVGMADSLVATQPNGEASRNALQPNTNILFIGSRLAYTGRGRLLLMPYDSDEIYELKRRLVADQKHLWQITMDLRTSAATIERAVQAYADSRNLLDFLRDVGGRDVHFKTPASPSHI